MPAEDWFDHWLADLQAKLRYGAGMWVAPTDAGFYLAWLEAFDEVGLTEEEAYTATRRLQVDRPPYPDRVPKAIKDLLPEIRRSLPVAQGGIPSTREEAEKRSAGCPECSGVGIAIRYVHQDCHGHFRTARGNPVPVGSSVSGWCGSCPMGRFLASSNAQGGKPGRTWDDDPRFRVAYSPATGGHDNQYRHKPQDWDAERGMPYAPEFEVNSLDDLKRLVASLAASKRSDGPFVPAKPRTPQEWEARAVPGRAYLADTPADDPVIDRERSRAAPTPPPTQEIHLPEDDLDWT